MCSYLWVDDDTIAALVVPEGRGEAPAKPPAPPGPRISSNLEGSVSQARTYQDLLKNTHDEDVFEYHGCSDLVYVKVGSCSDKSFPVPAKRFVRAERTSTADCSIRLLHSTLRKCV